MEFSEWFMSQMSAWITLVCAAIVLIGMFIIGHGKRKRARR
jgi:hypothetical protein